MIRFDLKCAADHRFDSWFQSAAAFDKLLASQMVTCAVCGSTKVEKAVMAPRVRTARSKGAKEVETVEAPAPRPLDRPLSAPASAAEQAVKALRAHIEANSDYVGEDFAKEARAIQNGTAPERPIYGESSLSEAKKLIDEGIEVAPLPFRSDRKTN
ncbi:DUF1178 family protein [Litorivita sp. NS0012-18]|uniref:DUF1178 family protein n=1 Tax=Litorivita sp. NS0012-18 TaxID=3127655 RepID=UPI00333EAED4